MELEESDPDDFSAVRGFLSSLDEQRQSLGCSRRALLKQRKLCHFCHRKPATLVEAGITEEALRFCSSSCLHRYKLEIFTRETMACLKAEAGGGGGTSLEEAGKASEVAVGERARKAETDNPRTETSSTSPPARKDAAPLSPRQAPAKRRNLPPRPHPSHLLNKRFWDEVRWPNFPYHNCFI